MTPTQLWGAIAVTFLVLWAFVAAVSFALEAFTEVNDPALGTNDEFRYVNGERRAS